jgi:hypothetical protein
VEKLQVKPDEQSELTRHCTQELLFKHFGVLPVHAFGYVHPLLLLHVAVWQASGAVQVTAGYVHPLLLLHVAVWQASGAVQVFVVYEHRPVLESHEPGELWHASGGLVQVTAAPAVHTPDLQDLGLQASELQLVFSGEFGYVHVPVLELHVPGVVWHAGGVLQDTPVPAVHTPDLQDLGVQESLLQLVLSADSAYVHTPVLELHVPGESWHAGGALQVTAVPAVHVPPWQVLGLHASELQLVVSGFAGFEQTPVVALQTPTAWHWSEAVQVPATQAPAEQVAHPEHAVPVFCQAPLPSQVWGWSPLHFTAAGAQTPPQAPELHTKGHAVPLFTHVPVASQVCG